MILTFYHVDIHKPPVLVNSIYKVVFLILKQVPVQTSRFTIQHFCNEKRLPFDETANGCVLHVKPSFQLTN